MIPIQIHKDRYSHLKLSNNYGNSAWLWPEFEDEEDTTRNLDSTLDERN